MQNVRLKIKNTIKSSFIDHCKAVVMQNLKNFTGYTFMQNLGLKVKIIPSDQVYIGNNFDNLYFHAKSKVKRKNIRYIIKNL